MAWSSLSARLSTLPKVLAGPMLRKATPDSVTVWLVTRSTAEVSLTVLGDDGPILTGKRATCAVGKNLHIVAVTAEAPAVDPTGRQLQPGVVYRYKLTFDFPKDQPPQTGVSLAAATNNAPLTYEPYTDPSFSLPPSQLSKLRVMHGSCRHLNGAGDDALALLDDLIAAKAQVADDRPHQLLMTGDQIYADDLSASMLVTLMDAADVLLGWTENLPLERGAKPANKIGYYLRVRVCDECGITSNARDHHVLSLGEYLCLYLMQWSDAFWQESDLPTAPQIEQFCQTIEPNLRLMAHIFWQEKTIKETELVKRFCRTLPFARRALANIPTYTIFDDHDVTDDFNMTRAICEKLYGNAMGRRLVQNGLVAYSLCQHWGNAPEQFAATSPPTPGARLLADLHKGDQATYETVSPNLQRLVGVHTAAEMRTPPGGGVFAAYHEPDGLTYDYVIESPCHRILMTDTRTLRSFPDGATELLSAAEIQRQIVKPDLGQRALIVVLSTNAPPAPIIRFATTHPTLSTVKESWLGDDDNPDLYESWELTSAPFDRLFKALSDNLPLIDGVRRGGVILLSGDVHSGFATRLSLSGRTRFEEPQHLPQRVDAVFAQLVASSFRNQTSPTIKQHRGGYEYPKLVLHEERMPPEGFVGWNLPSSVTRQVAHKTYEGRIGRDPVVIPITPHFPHTTAVVHGGIRIALDWPVDYQYRLDYLSANLENTLPFPWLKDLADIPGGATAADRRKALSLLANALDNYRSYNKSGLTKREMVGTNNIGELTFDGPVRWNAGDSKHVVHTVRWADPDSQQASISTYAVSLDPADSRFKFTDVAPTGWAAP